MDREIGRRLSATLEKNRDKYLDKLLELVAIDTRTIGHGIEGGREKGGQDYLAALLEEMGADRVELDQVEEAVIAESIRRYHEGNPGHNYHDRYNVYGTFGTSGRSLMFNGHMDTMPPGELEKWDTPPWTPTILGDRIHGLGVDDMKGGIMASVMAVQLLRDAGIPVPGRVIISSVVDEEGGGNGSIHAAMRGQRADGVVVCEATDGNVIAAHMRFCFFAVEVEGRAVHCGTKWKGVNAIEKAMKLIGALHELEHRWLMTCRHPLLPAPSVNVGVIEGGSAGSTVPDSCRVKICVHHLPGTTREQLVEEFTGAIDLCCRGDEWLREHPPRISVYQEGGAFEMDMDHPFAAAFQRAHSAVHGKPATVAGSPGGCDARTWRHLAGCPTLLYGPGLAEQGHTVNEYIRVEEYFRAILVYAHLILEWNTPDDDRGGMS